MNHNKKIIFFNGPPGCGKDLAVNYVAASLSSLKTSCAIRHERIKMADPLKKAVHALYGLFYSSSHYDNPKYAAEKDKPHPLMLGLSPREAYIAMSEEYCKPKHGKDFFGILMANRIHSSSANTFLCSDGGFVDEWIPIIKVFGAKNVACFEIHPDGYTSSSFDNDSRSYIGNELLSRFPKMTVRKIPNTFGDLDDRIIYQQMCWAAAKRFLGLD